MALTKAKLVESLAARLGINKREARDLVDEFFATINSALGRGEEVKLSGFGTLKTRHKRLRNGRHPRTGEIMPIAPRRAVTFQPGELLRLLAGTYLPNKDALPK